jgi:DNA modification methylase
MVILQGDNLRSLQTLKEQGAKFDLVELDGPYMAGLEDWDTITEAEYIQHYAERLALVRDILQPWGVVFVFGYPEGCAEIKSWAHRTGTLHLRRWLTWYKQVTAHKGRKVENILFFLRDTPTAAAAAAFGQMLKTERLKHGWTLDQVGRMANKPWWHRGGNLYFETGSGGFPSVDDFVTLAKIFSFNPNDWPHIVMGSYEGITEIDYLSKSFPENTTDLNDNGLRSKPVGLYLDLFRPTMPPIDERRALVLYGGSGNAGIAAAALGYDVSICEASAARCQAIEARFDQQVRRWQAQAQQKTIFDVAEQPSLLGAFV